MGADHPWTLGCALNAAAARNRAGDEEGAVELGRDTLQRAAEALGDTHPLTLSAKTALADDLRALRRGQGRREAGAGGAAAAHRHPRAPSTRTRSRPAAGARPYWDFEPQPVLSCHRHGEGPVPAVAGTGPSLRLPPVLRRPGRLRVEDLRDQLCLLCLVALGGADRRRRGVRPRDAAQALAVRDVGADRQVQVVDQVEAR